MKRVFAILMFLLLAGTTVPTALLAVPQSRSDAVSAQWAIRLLAGTLTPAAGLDAGTRTRLESRAAQARAQGAAKIHTLLQLEYIPTNPQKADLAARGIELQTYVPNYAWIAAIPAQDPAAVVRVPGVRWVGDWSAEDKLHPDIKADLWDMWAVHPTENMVMVVVQLHADVSLDRGAVLAKAHGGVALPPIQGIHGMTVWIPKENLLALAGEEEIVWVEEGPAPLSPNNDGIRASMHVNEVQAPPYSLDGSGVRIFVFDGGTVRTTHTTFDPGTGSRVIMIDDVPDVQDHPTHVAGTAAGDGNGGRAKGVAPGATVLSAEYEQTGGTMLFWDNFGDIEADYATARNSYNADLGTNSIGSNTASNGYNCAREGDYGVSSNMLDGIVRGDDAAVGSPVIMTWANGNERSGGITYPGRCGSSYHTTAPPACAKNPIQVGAINSDYDSMTSFSSWGPCDDGRLKPIVSAPGCELGRATGESFIYSSLATNDNAWGGSGWCGTSMATPAVAGVVALMIQDWRAHGYGGANDRPLPALVKAMLIHTTDDRGQDGPDYIYGYGEVNAKSVIDLIRNGNPLGGAGPTHWGTDSISQGVTDTWTVNVPACTAQFKVSLAWDDYAAAAFSAFAPVNDLDLEVVGPDNTVYYPWVLGGLAAPYQPATTGVNSLDNQEQVLVSNPAAGTWTIRVKGTTVPQAPQTYGLVYTTQAPTYEARSCAEQIVNGGFETGTNPWTLSGAQRVAAPATGHGSWSLRLGGGNSNSHTAYQELTIPTGAARAELSFWWYMSTNEGTLGHGYDFFYAEVRTTAGAVLATFDYRSDGWQAGQWLKSENMDLTPWAGQTIRITFYATTNNTRTTTFWVDDVSLETCLPLASSWVGTTASWNMGSNWSNGVTPACCTDSTIPTSPGGGQFPTTDASAEVGTLTIQTGSQVTMTADTLGICRDLDVQGTGKFNGTGGTVVFKGSSDQAISMTVGTNGQFHDLQIGDGSTSQTVRINTNLDVAGNLVIQQNATLAAGAHTLYVAGNWTDYGTTFAPGTSTVILDGATQTVQKRAGPGWDGDLAFYSLAVSSTATFNGNVAASHDLTINVGAMMDVDTHKITGVGGTYANQGTLSNNETRPVTSTSGAQTFLDGRSNNAVRITYISGGEPGNTTVTTRIGTTIPYNAFGSGCSPIASSVRRYYHVTADHNTGLNVSLRLYYDDAELNGNTEASLKIWHWEGGSWVNRGGTVDAVNNYVETTVTSFSPFILSAGSPTGVTLLGFAATPGADAVTLAWETADESQVLGFNVYRADSPAGTPTQLTTALIPATASGQAAGASYTYQDETAVPGARYTYWLETVDLAGRGTRYGPVEAAVGPGRPLHIYLPLVRKS